MTLVVSSEMTRWPHGHDRRRIDSAAAQNAIAIEIQSTGLEGKNRHDDSRVA